MQENHSLSWHECFLQRRCLEVSTGSAPSSLFWTPVFLQQWYTYTVLVNIISLLLAALCWTSVFNLKSVVHDEIDKGIDLFIFWLNVAPSSRYIICFLLSLCIPLPSSLSTAWMSSSQSCEVVMVLVQKPSGLLLLWSVSQWLTQIRSFHLSDYGDRNYNISKHNQLSFVQTDIQSTVKVVSVSRWTG